MYCIIFIIIIAIIILNNTIYIHVTIFRMHEFSLYVTCICPNARSQECIYKYVFIYNEKYVK